MTNKLEKTILALALVGSMATASYVVYDTINPNRQYILNTLTSLYRRVFEPPHTRHSPARKQQSSSAMSRHDSTTSLTA